jgi:GNAT superfamily N-acetyltransferase
MHRGLPILRNCTTDFHLKQTVSAAKGYSFSVEIRPALDQDSAGIIDLIARVFAEYPGVYLLVDQEEPKLRTPASSYPHFWVLQDRERILGCIACGAYSGTYELQKLYLDSSLRRQGWGRKLVELVENQARAEGFEQIELWTDTKFETAHRVYEKLGYQATGRRRELHDISDTSEFHYQKDL